MSPELSTEAIRTGAAKLGLALDLATSERLQVYARLLQRWSAVHNLTAIRRGEDVLTHHLLDSLSVVPQLARSTSGAPIRMLDVGSGGGLPGLVLAIVQPQIHVTLVDAMQKKCAFLTQAQLELRLTNVEVIHSRVEDLAAPAFDVIMSRALSSLAQFVEWTRHLLEPGGTWIAMKGQVPDDELAQLPGDIRAIAVIPLTVPGLGEQRHLIEMTLA